MTESLPTAAAPGVPAPLTPMQMLSNALQAGASTEVLDKLLSLQERWEATEARKAFNVDMAAAAAELPILVKDAEVKFETKQGGKTGYTHVSLAEAVGKVAPILGKHGLHHRFEVTNDINKPVTVTCVITHRLGHEIRNTLTGPPDTSGSKNSLQAIGSTVHYLSRYTFMAALGLAADKDDDGRSFSAPQAKPDVMQRTADAVPTIDVVVVNEGAGYTAPPAGNADVAVSAGRGNKRSMTITEIAAFEKAALNAARQGTAVMRDFWKNASSMQERAILEGMLTDIKRLRLEADARLINEEGKSNGG